MKKSIVFIIISIIVVVLSILLLIPMIHYVASFHSTVSSFMTFDEAVITVVVLSLIIILGLSLFVVFLIQIIKIRGKE